MSGVQKKDTEVIQMGIKRDVNRYKKQLLKKAREKGLWEDFGQDKVRKLEDKYDTMGGSDDWKKNNEEIRRFSEWCRKVTDRDLEVEE